MSNKAQNNKGSNPFQNSVGADSCAPASHSRYGADRGRRRAGRHLRTGPDACRARSVRRARCVAKAPADAARLRPLRDFSGRVWRSELYPRLRELIRQHDTHPLFQGATEVDTRNRCAALLNNQTRTRTIMARSKRNCSCANTLRRTSRHGTRSLVKYHLSSRLGTVFFSQLHQPFLQNCDIFRIPATIYLTRPLGEIFNKY